DGGSDVPLVSRGQFVGFGHASMRSAYVAATRSAHASSSSPTGQSVAPLRDARSMTDDGALGPSRRGEPPTVRGDGRGATVRPPAPGSQAVLRPHEAEEQCEKPSD